MKTKQEDAAFGCVGVLSREEDVYNHGLTKREYFAAMAMNGMLANSYSNGSSQPLSELSYSQIAEFSVRQADALIIKLNKEV
ncbi:hypothetical protein G7050_16015 [Dysgonomonas sp. HDW5A]|uniref:hypothetical protein n=1 Tax=Dysgonomonas sp. HDW5A TaxID=2714926 RepID=UPI00140CCD41|nr:hypothetical protein [Dysgonomonas sp. HDW5A]QIK61260.1 hypothetical protein G7050_16015 [Dysgonomonas sp. HDW5A]